MDKAFAKILKKITLEKKIFKYLIVGSNGLLGSEFKKILNKSTYMSIARNNSDYNIDLTKKSQVFITDGIKPKKILKKSRIGITKGTEKLWNFT